MSINIRRNRSLMAKAQRMENIYQLFFNEYRTVPIIYVSFEQCKSVPFWDLRWSELSFRKRSAHTAVMRRNEFIFRWTFVDIQCKSSSSFFYNLWGISHRPKTISVKISNKIACFFSRCDIDSFKLHVSFKLFSVASMKKTPFLRANDLAYIN